MEEPKNENSKNKVVKAGIGYTVSNFLIRGIGFITIPIFSRLLTTSDYGLYNTYEAYAGIFMHIICLALYTSLKNAKYKYKDRYYQYVSSILLVQLFSSGCWLIFCSIFLKPLSNLFGIDKVCVLLMIIEALGSGILTLYNVDASIDYSYQSYLKLAATNSVLNVVLSVVFILTIFDSHRYLGRIFGGVLTYLILLIFVFYHYWHKEKPTINREYWSFGLKYGVPLVPHAISQIILNQFDRIMINSMIGASEAGIYSFAYNIYTIVSVIFSSLDNVWSPWFYEKMEKNDPEAIKERSTDYARLMLVICVGVLLVAPELIKILGPSSYWDSIYCVIPIVAAGYFTFLYTIPCQVEYYHAKTGFISIATGLAALVNIITNYIFIKLFGYVAAAYTTLFTYILYFIFHYALAIHIEGKCLFDTKRMVLCGLTMLVVSLIDLVILPYTIFRWILAIVLFVALMVTLNKKYSLLNSIKTMLRK